MTDPIYHKYTFDPRFLFYCFFQLEEFYLNCTRMQFQRRQRISGLCVRGRKEMGLLGNPCIIKDRSFIEVCENKTLFSFLSKLLTHYHTIPHFDLLKIYSCRKQAIVTSNFSFSHNVFYPL